jgi:hypothetical protein
MSVVKDKIKSFEKLNPPKYNLVPQTNLETVEYKEIIKEEGLVEENNIKNEEENNIEHEKEKEINMNEFEPVTTNKTRSYCYFLCQFCQDFRTIVDKY